LHPEKTFLYPGLTPEPVLISWRREKFLFLFEVGNEVQVISSYFKKWAHPFQLFNFLLDHLEIVIGENNITPKIYYSDRFY
jgi:hypothetical protein